MIRLLICTFLPLLLLGNSNTFSEFFAHEFMSQNTVACYEVLDEWLICEPEMEYEIQALRASVLLLEGDVFKSMLVMENALNNLPKTSSSADQANAIRHLYKQVLDFEPIEHLSAADTGHGYSFTLCGVQQPRGVKIRYWFGIAQLVAACVIAPFNPPLAGTIAASGIAATVQAYSEAIDNKDEWERNLNARQRISAEN